MKQLPLSNKLILSDYELTSLQPVYRNITNTGKTSIKSQQYQLYKGEVELTAFGYDNVKTLVGFSQSLNGGMETIAIKLPVMKQLKPITGSPQLNIAYNKNTTEIKIDNFVGVLSVGDYFNIQNDPKLYMLTSSGVAGNTFTISPSLRTDQPVAAKLSFDAVLTARLDDEDYTIKPNKTVKVLKVTFKFTEDL
uniref:hypothetical protein n=1 Tax=Shewanella sp. TaxID=50422 RepID=UPI0040473F05